MISSVEISNFKCFEHLRLDVGSLTLLTGFNGGGKSSAIQPILLLAQGMRQGIGRAIFSLNGALVQLGTISDVLPADSNNPSISFRVIGVEDEAIWVFTTRAGDRYLQASELNLPGGKTNPERSGGVARSLSRLVFLSAVRGGTADAYPMPEAGSALGDVGSDGRFAAYWYDQLVDNEVELKRRHLGEPATSMRKQLDAWMGTLFPGAQANVQLIPQMSLLNLQFRLSEIGAWRRPANIGYGLTYAFPILVALLSAEEGQTVVIDSPEAHLHPYAQSRMGRLLGHFSAAGIQIIVETHSDHLLNGARLAVQGGGLSHSELRLHFFTGAKRENHGVVSPTLDATGRIDEWPEGFFDQSEKDLSLLAGWK